ncbi:helix-turn-helix domain-containing protein [Clostridium estertheticum]|uniref:response regulator n=1 Tax=Clostridium estertheticum TaxID=238834 RepID=UPI0013EE7AE9|nr:response regulator [Clostridium estertheticum]MBZ9609875.1 helix-turn-helix domain-containing protein [Clostridium estertheticum]
MNNSGIRIMIIDDDPGIVDSIKSFLGDKYYVEGYTSSREGLKQLKNKKFDILILDYYIDELTAKDVIEEIRKYNNDLYIMLLTGHGEEITGIQSLENLKIQNYYEKNADFEKLIIFIEGIVKSLDFFNNKRCTIAERLKKLRKNNELTQDNISKYLDIHRTTVTQYESGEIIPTTQNIIKLAKLYNVTTDYILCYELNIENNIIKGLKK